jgi:hypothetical protein
MGQPQGLPLQLRAIENRSKKRLHAAIILGFFALAFGLAKESARADQGQSRWPLKTHWAWLAPKRAPLPRVNDGAWPKNPVDYFILARLE